MAQRSVEERLAEMRQRIEALRAAQQRLEARQNAAERKRRERRRYLLGSFVLEKLADNERLRDYVRRELPGWLREERDRALFAGLLGTGSAGESGPAAEASPAGGDGANLVNNTGSPLVGPGDAPRPATEPARGG